MHNEYHIHVPVQIIYCAVIKHFKKCHKFSKICECQRHSPQGNLLKEKWQVCSLLNDNNCPY